MREVPRHCCLVSSACGNSAHTLALATDQTIYILTVLRPNDGPWQQDAWGQDVSYTASGTTHLCWIQGRPPDISQGPTVLELDLLISLF